jgi:RNAse (barnase) inhibitor barstar
MKIPELAQAAEAGVLEWSGAPDALKTAAVAAKLKFALVDLHGVGSKTELMAALAKGLGLPEHFGNNWDALADSLEDSDWLGAHGIAIALRHTKTFAGAHHADWSTLSEILGEAAEYWRELHKPFWVFVA